MVGFESSYLSKDLGKHISQNITVCSDVVKEYRMYNFTSMKKISKDKLVELMNYVTG